MTSRSSIVRLVLAVVLGASALTATTGVIRSDPVRAECSGDANVWPAFTKVAPTARRIFVGTVVESLTHGGRWFGRFRVRVDETLRGPHRESAVIDFIVSGLPPTGSQACRDARYLQARVGDVIAFAFGGHIRGVRGSVRTAAWLETRPSPWNPGIERLSLSQVRRIALRLPDTATAPVDTPAATATDTTLADRRRVALVVSMAADALVWLRRLAPWSGV